MSEIGKAGLQSQIAKLLDERGIVYVKGRTDKPRPQHKARGFPDFIFACWLPPSHMGPPRAMPVAWEIKLPKKTKAGLQLLRPEQKKMRERMTTAPNAWRYSVITSLDEAIAELRAMGLIWG